jgi:hypothetical protein
MNLLSRSDAPEERRRFPGPSSEMAALFRDAATPQSVAKDR